MKMKMMSLLVTFLLLMTSACMVSGNHFTTRYPWCDDSHKHIHLVEEAENYLHRGHPHQYHGGTITFDELGTLIHDALHRVRCEDISPECCHDSLTAGNIYTVLRLEQSVDLEEENYEKSNTILLTWLLHLSEKCNSTTDWDSVNYEDFVHEILDFEYDHDHDHDHSHEHLDEGDDVARFHDDSHEVDDDDHHHHLSPEQLEGIIREINETYRAGDMPHRFHDDDHHHDSNCSHPDAWVVKSRTIWRDVERHANDHIDDDEIGNMAAILNLYLLYGYCLEPDRVLEDDLPSTESFIIALFNEYGSRCKIDEHGFEELLEDLHIVDDHHGHEHSVRTTRRIQSRDHHDGDHDHDHDHGHSGPYGPDVKQSCLDGHDLAETFYADYHHGLHRDEFERMSVALVQQSVQGCQYVDEHEDDGPTDAQKFGYGTLAVLVICLCAFLGLIVVKWRHTKAYKYTIVTMLGLAAGSLSADSLLHLIPHGLVLHDHSHSHAHDIADLEVETYVWKMLSATGAIWLFFLLQIALSRVHSMIGGGQKIGMVSTDFSTKAEHDNPAYTPDMPDEKAMNGHAATSPEGPDDKVTGKIESEVAVMAMVGDGIHNFADGLAIGAAFSADLSLGLSTSIAVLCHEIPHEFGDVAIALSAGWSVKKVALAQLLSALFAFVGLYIGVPVSENANAQHWILVITSGMFLYIALCDVMPELLEHYRNDRSWTILILMNVGFLIGVVFMLLLAIFEEYIRV